MERKLQNIRRVCGEDDKGGVNELGTKDVELTTVFRGRSPSPGFGILVGLTREKVKCKSHSPLG